MPGKDWMISFMRRHRLSAKCPSTLEKSRKSAASDPNIIYGYYDNVEHELIRHKISNRPECIWNIDETSLFIDPRKIQMEESVESKPGNGSCCDPFKIHKIVITKGLRSITRILVEKYPNSGIILGQKICDSCRRKLRKKLPDTVPSDSLYFCFGNSDKMESSNNSNAGALNYFPNELENNLSNDRLNIDNLSNSPVHESISDFCEQSLTVIDDEEVKTEAKHYYAQQGIDTSLIKLDISEYDETIEDTPTKVKNKRIKEILNKAKTNNGENRSLNKTKSNNGNDKSLNKFPVGQFKVKMNFGKGVGFKSQKKRESDDEEIYSGENYNEDNEQFNNEFKRQWDDSPSSETEMKKKKIKRSQPRPASSSQPRPASSSQPRPARTVNVDYEAIKLPLVEGGWVREIVVRGTPNARNRKRSDTYYYAPNKRKMRSSVEVEKYLSETRSPYTRTNFSFGQLEIGVGEPYEIMRGANIREKVECSLPNAKDLNKNEVKNKSDENSEAVACQKPKNRQRKKPNGAMKWESLPSTSKSSYTHTSTTSILDDLLSTPPSSKTELNFLSGSGGNKEDLLPPCKKWNDSSLSEKKAERTPIPIIQFLYEDLEKEDTDLSQSNVDSLEKVGAESDVADMVNGEASGVNIVPEHLPKKNSIRPDVKNNTLINDNLSNTKTVFTKISPCTVRSSSLYPSDTSKENTRVETSDFRFISEPRSPRNSIRPNTLNNTNNSISNSINNVSPNMSSCNIPNSETNFNTHPRKSNLVSNVNGYEEKNKDCKNKTKDCSVDDLELDFFSSNQGKEGKQEKTCSAKQQISSPVERNIAKTTQTKGNIKSGFILNKDSVFPLFQITSNATPASSGRTTPVKELVTASSCNNFNVSGISTISEEEWGKIEDAEKNGKSNSMAKHQMAPVAQAHHSNNVAINNYGPNYFGQSAW